MGTSEKHDGAFEELRIAIKIRAQRVEHPTGKVADVEVEFGAESFLFGLRLGGFAVWRDRDNDRLFVKFPASRRHRRTSALLTPTRTGADLDLRTAIVATVAAMEEARHIECVWQRPAGTHGTLKRLTIH